MKCMSCGEEMRNTIGGNYTCGKCGSEVNDLVYRPYTPPSSDIMPNYTREVLGFGNQGWICPKCGTSISPTVTYCPLCCLIQNGTIFCSNLSDLEYTTITNTNTEENTDDK